MAECSVSFVNQTLSMESFEQIKSRHSSFQVPLQEVCEYIHNFLLQRKLVLNDGVSFVGHLMLKLLQLHDLLTNLELGETRECEKNV